MNWLIQEYRTTPRWLGNKPATRKTQFLEQERFRARHGDKMIADLRPHHVERLMAEKHHEPAAANSILKLIKKLSRYAVKRGIIHADPTVSVERFPVNKDGFHTWTASEVQQYEAFHGVQSKAVLALRLFLYTGGSRADVVKMGWQTVRDNRIRYRRKKTQIDVDLPIKAPLREVLTNADTDCPLFITHNKGRPYTVESFGNWFKQQCKAAGLHHCASHGIRKHSASFMAERDTTESQMAAYLGHTNNNEAQTYFKKARRSKLGDGAMKAFDLDNPTSGLSKNESKVLKLKDN
ncbi:MAG: tyrosine-type recombinase/integrase [Pseudomonadota bacterium]